MTHPQIGDKAPQFTLTDTNLKPQSLREFEGQKVVLAFFIGTFTSACTKEVCIFRDSMSRLINLKAQVIGISVNDPVSNKAFAEKNRLNFPILSDYNREVTETYNLQFYDLERALEIKCRLKTKRAIFVLDKRGIIRYVWVTEDPTVEPDYQAIERALKKID